MLKLAPWILLPGIALFAADTSRPFALLSPPKGVTPANSREPYSWSPPNVHAADVPGRPPRPTWTAAERQAYEARVEWFHEAKYGLFFHFLSGGQRTPEEWNQWVDGVNVEKVADQAKQLGAGYVILTLGQNQKYACAPNPVIAKHWGAQYTSKRDLPMDLQKALEKRGIRMMLYLATDRQHRMPRPPDMKGNARFDLWLEVAPGSVPHAELKKHASGVTEADYSATVDATELRSLLENGSLPHVIKRYERPSGLPAQ